jgi:hypothetical protein
MQKMQQDMSFPPRAYSAWGCFKENLAGPRFLYVYRRARRHFPRRDNCWPQIARLSGLELIGSSFNRVQLRGTAEALNQLKDRFGHVLNIEEAIARKPGS